ncbi:MAG TPA: VCBS repeat-containing protein [Gemmatimonadaceae bacterium]|nr:VCBS repeat-containing protein [Gemmatimonadaceae bacterium]
MNRGVRTAAVCGCLALSATALVHKRPAAREWAFVARASGIPVADTAGVRMAAPFLGGFDVPRPQLVDINGDGTPELFVQERTGDLMMFERVNGEWTLRSEKFQNLDIGEWYRFVDLDGDGVIDLLTERVNGYARAWRNTGTRADPKLVAFGDTIRDVDGRALLVDRQNILNAVDIDCNRKLDLFVGRVQGTVDRYEQEGTSPDGSPRFRLMEEMWQGIEVLGPEATGGTLRIDTTTTPSDDPVARSPLPLARLHGANTLTFADLNGKGIYDLFWGDFFEQGLLRFENTGTCAQPDLTGKPARFPADKPLLTSGYNAPTFGDVDGDGLRDLVVGVIGGAYGPARTAIDNLYYLRQSPKDTWTVATKRLIPTIDVGAEAAPAFGDVNGDGLIDMIVGSKIAPGDGSTGTLTFFENVGTANAPTFRDRGVLPIKGQYNYAPAIVDLDGDGLVDLVLGTWQDRLEWYRNTGTSASPKWTLADSALVTITRGSNTTPSFGDIDGDGLVDLVIGEASGTINLYRNTGTKTSPKYALVSDHFQDIKVVRRSAPALVDMDGDGKPDMLIGSGDGEIQLWHNVGARGELRFERDNAFTLRSFMGASPAASDLRHAGQPDLFVGTASGGVRWFENRTQR